jgi:hypothetical protein
MHHKGSIYLLFTVKTLAIRSTAEEAMIRRREALKGLSGKLPGVTEEAGMRYFIEVKTRIATL